MAAVNNVTQAAELIKMEQYTTTTSTTSSSGSNNITNSNKHHQPSMLPSTSTGTADGLSGLDLFGQIVEAMPASIPTVVENINNNRDLDVLDGSKECKL